MTYHIRGIAIIGMAAVLAAIAGPATAADLLPRPLHRSPRNPCPLPLSG